MLTRKCECCDGPLHEEPIKLASERRVVLAYHCVTCGRTEYGAVISAHKRVFSECKTARGAITGADRIQSDVQPLAPSMKCKSLLNSAALPKADGAQK